MKKITLNYVHTSRTEKATKKSWKTLSFGKNKSPLNVFAEYTDLEFAKISEGFIPVDMEDKWFIYMEDDTLWCHRSWTGQWIFEARFVKDGDKYAVKETFTAKLKDENDEKAKTYLGRMLLFLINAILLGKDAVPPEMEGNKQNPAETFCERFHLYGFQGVGKWELDSIEEVMKEIKEKRDKQ